MDFADDSPGYRFDSSTDLVELLMFAASSVYNSKSVLRFLTYELQSKETGFLTTLLELEDTDEDKLTRTELLLKRQQMNIPRSIFEAITLLKLVRQIRATREKTVFRKFFNEMDLELQPFVPTSMAFRLKKF